ncbi:hypothetical protein EB093_08400 [bacterium]|nr:hypothetical protein [bacterium]
MKIKFRNKKELVIACFIIYGLGNCFSFVGFYYEYKTWLQIDNGIGGNFLTGFVSLPIAFGNFIFSNMYDFGSVVLLSLFFWGVVIFLLRRLFISMSVLIFLILATVFLIASWKWLIVTETLMGI